MHDGFGPDERSCGVVIAGDEAVDVLHQCADAAERAALEGLAGQDGKPDLDLVQPGSMGRRVMQMHVGVPRIAGFAKVYGS